MSSLITDMNIFESGRFEEVKSNRKGVLRTIKGPLAEWDTLNRNARKYTERLWDKVLESPYVKEQTKYRTLFGEANHPEGRLEVDFERVSHSITEMHKGSDKTVYGTIDILDTPLGRILNVLYEYGSTLGISSRAGGVLHQKKGFTEVDEDSYHFVTFDIVPFPSVAKARLVSEGVNTFGSDRLEISESAHRDLINIIEGCSQKEKSILKEFIYKLDGFNLDKEINILEGLNVTSKGEEHTDNSKIADTTLYLLKESYQVSAKLKEENSLLQDKVSQLEIALEESKQLYSNTSNVNEGLKCDVIKAVNEKSEMVAKVATLNKELSNLKNTISINESTLLDSEMARFELKELSESNESLIKVVNKLRQDSNSYVLEGESYKKIIKEKDEIIHRLSGQLISLRESSTIHSDYTELANELIVLTKELEDMKSLNEQTSHHNVEELEQTIKTLQEQLNRRGDELVNINESVDNTNSLVRALEFEIENIHENYSNQLDKYQGELVSAICGNYGVNTTHVMGYLKEGFNAGDVHLICENLVNRNSNPIIYNAVDNSSMVHVEQKQRMSTIMGASRRG